MDASHLVARMRAIAEAPTRRAVLRGLAALAPGTVLAPLFAPLEAQARRKKQKGNKKKKRPKNARPSCAGGLTRCGGACVDATTNAANCGGCGRTCGQSQNCTGGACVPVPPTCSDGVRNGDESDVDCGGSCAAKCADGKACGADPDCQSGHCVSAVCRECATAGHCGAGRDCVGNRCCIVDGFESQNACTADAECCSGNCATYEFGTTCRPAGCVPPGVSCDGNPSVCCSWTCSGTCQ